MGGRCPGHGLAEAGLLPVAWAGRPYPWPQGRFTPTACALIADRAVPRRPLVRTLPAVGWGWTLRLGARSVVTGNGVPQWAGTLLAVAQVGRWATDPAATYGSAAPVIPGPLVIERQLPVVPWHQRDTGSWRQRAKPQAARHRDLTNKNRKRRGRPGTALHTDAWVILVTTHPTWRVAQASYRRRWSIAGSFRDAQEG